MKAPGTERIDLSMEELEGIIERAGSSPLTEEEQKKLRAALQTLEFVTRELEDKRGSIRRLRKVLFGAKTEKTDEVLGVEERAEEAAESSSEVAGSEEELGERENDKKGHGRNGAEKYEGAERISVHHDTLKAGDRCPECEKGKVYRLKTPKTLVRIVGQPPLKATVCECERLRCNLCGTVFTAKAPAGLAEEKYDATAASMIALLKYGSGLPFNRLQGLEGNLGIPLPASTQWDIVYRSARLIEPVYAELILQAAQGEVLHNDDTTMRILELMGKRIEKREEKPERTGIFTSGVVSVGEGRRIALFFTGQKHAGENLHAVLSRRAAGLRPPIQMCDALAQNIPAEFKVILANCLAHARRRFVDVVENFPEECRYVLETLRDVYRNDAAARRRKMSPQERLEFHQARSGSLMADLETWLTEQLQERKVEPNSPLGEAISYMLSHWKELTLFLREPGAPLDNNVCERGLKKAILHRKNAYFYRSERGARVGDLFMSLIHTSELSGVSPFEYLTELQRSAERVKERPAEWMPWNYRSHLERGAALS